MGEVVIPLGTLLVAGFGGGDIGPVFLECFAADREEEAEDVGAFVDGGGEVGGRPGITESRGLGPAVASLVPD